MRIQDPFIPLSLQALGNFDSVCIFLHGYELFQTGSCSFELVAGDSFGLVVPDGFRWLQMVSGGFGWFQIVLGGLLF